MRRLNVRNSLSLLLQLHHTNWLWWYYLSLRKPPTTLYWTVQRHCISVSQEFFKFTRFHTSPVNESFPCHIFANNPNLYTVEEFLFYLLSGNLRTLCNFSQMYCTNKSSKKVILILSSDYCFCNLSTLLFNEWIQGYANIIPKIARVPKYKIYALLWETKA